jgi:hypothetical protein
MFFRDRIPHDTLPNLFQVLLIANFVLLLQALTKVHLVIGMKVPLTVHLILRGMLPGPRNRLLDLLQMLLVLSSHGARSLPDGLPVAIKPLTILQNLTIELACLILDIVVFTHLLSKYTRADKDVIVFMACCLKIEVDFEW